MVASIQDADMQIRHQLREGDAERRVQYSQWLLGKPQAFMPQKTIIIGDEAIFQLNGNVSITTSLSVMHPVVIQLKTLSTTNPLLEKSLLYGSGY